MSELERGRQGEPGQTGREGVAGQTGQQGLPGAIGASGARGKSGIRVSDRRLLVIFGVILVGMALVVWNTTRQSRSAERQNADFQHQITANCVSLNDSHVHINAILDQAADTVMSNADRPIAERQEIAKAYRGLHLAILPCPQR